MTTKPTAADLDYKDLFRDAVHMLAEVAKAAGFDPADENVEPPAIIARVARQRTDLRRMTDHAAALEAEVSKLRAEVETLRQGWQAERDAAARAHDLLMAERAVRS